MRITFALRQRNSNPIQNRNHPRHTQNWTTGRPLCLPLPPPIPT